MNIPDLLEAILIVIGVLTVGRWFYAFFKNWNEFGWKHDASSIKKKGVIGGLETPVSK